MASAVHAAAPGGDEEELFDPHVRLLNVFAAERARGLVSLNRLDAAAVSRAQSSVRKAASSPCALPVFLSPRQLRGAQGAQGACLTRRAGRLSSRWILRTGLPRGSRSWRAMRRRPCKTGVRIPPAPAHAHAAV
jgi:hypothetical protein